MIYRSSDQEISNYYASGNINQSSLKYILERGMEDYLQNKERLLGQEDLYYEEKEWLIIGSAVDCILTCGREEFERKYYFSKLLKKPGEKVMSILKSVYDAIVLSNTEVNQLFRYAEAIWYSCNQHEYYMNRVKTYTEDTRVAGILSDPTAIEYWDDLKSSAGRQILSDEQFNTINTVAENFLNHEHTKGLFTDVTGLDFIFQLPLYFNNYGTACKMMPDEIMINHRAKRIIPLDFKTMSGYVSRFNKSARKRRYDIQGAFYTDGIQKSLQTISDLIGKDVSDYTIARFAFAVESTTNPGTPMIFPLTEDLLNVGRSGDGDELLGYVQALGLYNIWADNEFRLDKVVSSTGGVVLLGKDYEYNLDV